MKEIKTSTGILIILAAAVLIGGGAMSYFYVNQPTWYDLEEQFAPTVKAPARQVTTEFTASKSADVTADWKTYINQINGFSFKYPSTWYTDISSNSFTVVVSNYENSTQFTKETAPADLNKIMIWEYSDSRTNTKNVNAVIKQEIINNIRVYSLKNTEGISEELYAKAGIFQSGGKKYEICIATEMPKTNMQSEINYFDKIISTFQFSQ